MRLPLALHQFALVLGVTATSTAVPAASRPAPPRLAVVISIDQFRYDYLTRFRPYFEAGGFERLLEGGANFENCTYRYASTKTAVGHATMLTGCNPEAHGIVGNEWADPTTLLSVIAVEDEDAPLVGLAPSTMRLPGGTLDKRAGRSPRHLLAPALGERLKETFGAEAKVFGISNKDRSAILMAGAHADGVYWDESGRFITSAYYRDTLPSWVEAFNAQGWVDGHYGARWDRLRDANAYDTVQGPDDAPGEFEGDGFARTFPKILTGGEARPIGAFYSVFDMSPFASEFLALFARELIEQEHLGTDDTPDLLCISFSQIDALGHAYGPDSHEVMDAALRLDHVLAAFLSYLDERIGADNYVLVVTADHGVAPLPERSMAARPDGSPMRVRVKDLIARMTAALDGAFGPLPAGEVWFVHDNQGFHFRPSALAARGVEVAKASDVLRDALKHDPIIETAFTRAELQAAPREGTSLAALVRRSYHEARGQDVVYVVHPFFVEKSDVGTNHGTPWIYDRHVPQLWYGAGVPSGWRSEPTGMEDLAPTLAALLHVPPPARATGQSRLE